MSYLGYNRDVCDGLVTSRPFRFKMMGKQWFGDHRQYWLESFCSVGAESYQLGGLGSQVRIQSRTIFYKSNNMCTLSSSTSDQAR